MQSSPQRRRRCSVSTQRLLGLLLSILMAAGCSAGELAQADGSIAALPAATTQAVASTFGGTGQDQAAETHTAESETSEPEPTRHPITVADTELPKAPIGFESLFDAAPAGPRPILIEIENIDVRDAVIIPVGVNPQDLSFEVPPADQVGWYEFGAAPGEAGSAVLAAHIAFNGADGVFRYLENVEIGAVVAIGFDDGTTMRYRIEEVTEYVKEELPESLWKRDGKEQLALITCGGAFNYQLDSYESNTVAIAVPVV